MSSDAERDSASPSAEPASDDHGATAGGAGPGGSERQRIVRVPGGRRVRLTPAPGTDPEPVSGDEETDDAPQPGTGGAASGPNDDRLQREVPPHY